MQDTLVEPGSQRGAPIPWWGKIAAKMILSRLPVPHHVWSQLNVFRHSYGSQNAAEQVRAMRERIAWFEARTGRLPRAVLELGPGEVTTRAVVNKALGVERTIFVDVDDFGTREVGEYQRLAAAAREQGLAAPDLADAPDREEAFARCGAEYYVDGIASLKRLPAASVDFILSEAVIEHIRWHDLAPTFRQTRRLLAPDGVAWHAVDFQDHMGGKLENLRFPPGLWESRLMSSSGFYTNRASASEVMRQLRNAGFEVEVESRRLWRVPPTTRRRIARDLQRVWSDDDLRVSSITLVASLRGGGSAGRSAR